MSHSLTEMNLNPNKSLKKSKQIEIRACCVIVTELDNQNTMQMDVARWCYVGWIGLDGTVVLKVDGMGGVGKVEHLYSASNVD